MFPEFNVLRRASLATDKILDAVDCATLRVAQYFVDTTHNGANKTARVGAVFAKRHLLSEQFKATIKQLVV